MRLLDPSHPFFRPAWRRYLMVAVPFLWAGVEAYHGQMVWAAVFAALGAYCLWQLVLAFNPEDRG